MTWTVSWAVARLLSRICLDAKQVLWLSRRLQRHSLFQPAFDLLRNETESCSLQSDRIGWSEIAQKNPLIASGFWTETHIRSFTARRHGACSKVMDSAQQCVLRPCAATSLEEGVPW